MPEAILLNRIDRAHLPRPTLQYRAIPGRAFTFDMAWLDPGDRVLVSVQGGGEGGRHLRYAGYQEDQTKSNMAVAYGYRCLAFTAEMIDSGEAVEAIARVLGLPTCFNPEHSRPPGEARPS
jgi:hypothetical protein